MKKRRKFKACSKCAARKPLTGFHRDKNATTGRRPACKQCVSEKNARRKKTKKQIARGKAATARYRKTPKYKATLDRYRKTPKYKAAVTLQRKSPKGRVVVARRRAKEKAIARARYATPEAWAARRGGRYRQLDENPF